MTFLSVYLFQQNDLTGKGDINNNIISQAKKNKKYSERPAMAASTFSHTNLMRLSIAVKHVSHCVPLQGTGVNRAFVTYKAAQTEQILHFISATFQDRFTPGIIQECAVHSCVVRFPSIHFVWAEIALYYFWKLDATHCMVPCDPAWANALQPAFGCHQLNTDTRCRLQTAVQKTCKQGGFPAPRSGVKWRLKSI